MRTRLLVILIILILLKPGLNIPVLHTSAIHTDQVENRALKLPIRVNILVWGFDYDYTHITDQLTDYLPTRINTESYNYLNNTPSLHDINIEGRLFNYQTNIEYSFYRNTSTDYLIDFVNASSYKGIDAGLIDTEDGTRDVSGWRIPLSDMSSALAPNNIEDGYTIHLLDLSSLNRDIDENSTHWYNLGLTHTIDNSLKDIRNSGFAGEKGIFYDPTAYAPNFDGGDCVFNSTGELILEDLSNKINTGIREIVEKIVVGSPASVKGSLPLNTEYHIALIIIGDEEQDFEFNKAINYRKYIDFTHAVEQFMPYFSIEVKRVDVDLESHESLRDYLDGKTEDILGEPTVLITNQIAEDLKYLIRSDSSLYSDYPREYFYPIFAFIDSDERNYMVEAEDQEYRDYEVGYTGFSILNLKDWRGVTEFDANYLLYLEMNIFGKMMGLPPLDNFTSQFNSPLSDYGVWGNWQEEYSSFETDNLARRYSGLYNYTAMTLITEYRATLQKWYYSWINQTSLDIAEVKLIEGNILFYQGEYQNAVAKYIEGYDLYEDAIKEIILKINSVKNSIYFIIVLALFSYIIFFLKDISLDYEKYRKKVRSLLINIVEKYEK